MMINLSTSRSANTVSNALPADGGFGVVDVEDMMFEIHWDSWRANF
jgi:hypothetical protein